MQSTYKLLQLALAVFGVIMLLLYPLALVWPAGFLWHHGAPYESDYFMMIVGVYATLGVFLINAARNPRSKPQLDLVRGVVQRCARRNHGDAILQGRPYGTFVGRCPGTLPGGHRPVGPCGVVRSEAV